MLWVCAFFAVLDTMAFGLTDLDEGFYASVGREMYRTGDYLTPARGGEPWFEKPPLLYWGMTASMRLFGHTELAVRFPSVVAFWITLIALYLWGNRRLGEGVGTRAALIFSLAPLTLILSRLALTDMLLACWLTLALIGMWETARSPVWSLLWGAATGLAVLTKGPVGVGLVGVQALLSLPLLLKEGFRLRWGWLALLMALAVPIPWYAGVYYRHGGDFFQEFILKQNLGRFAGGDTAHAIPPLQNPLLYLFYYVFVLWLGLFPASLTLPKIAFGGGTPLQQYLQRWSWLVLGLFTLAATKLPGYVFPMVPAVCLLIASKLDERMGGWKDGQGLTRLVTSIPPYLHPSIRVFGSLIWLGASAILAWYSKNPLPLLFGVGLTALSQVVGGGLWAVEKQAVENNLKSETRGPKSKRFTLSLAHYLATLTPLLILTGFHFCLRALDTVWLKPPRELALAAPRDQVLGIYDIHPGFPSLGFYREGQVTDNNDEALRILRQGGYCLTREGVMKHETYEIIDDAKRVDRQRFVLLKGYVAVERH